MEIHNLPIVVVLMVSTVLNVGYFAPITFKAFFEGKKGRWKRGDIKEAPLTMVIPIVIASIMSVALGLFPQFFTELIGRLFP
jgi:multicomponent Na+:H+ antiporter subunit D